MRGRGQRGSGVLHARCLRFGGRAGVACVAIKPWDFLGIRSGWDGQVVGGHAMRHMYLRGVYYALQEEVMRNVSRDVLWSERNKGESKWFSGISSFIF